MKNYLITGFFGVNNLGDDIMLNSFCNEILKKDSSIKLTVLLLYGRKDCIDVPYGVDVVDIHNFKHGKSIIIDQVLNRIFDGLFWIGGTCITEKAGDGAYRYMNSFKRREKKTGYIGVGIANVLTKSKIDSYSNVLSSSDIVTVRDKNSYEIASKWCGKTNHLYLTEDLVYLYPMNSFERNTSNSKNILISWRSYKNYFSAEAENHDVSELCRYIFSISNQYDYIIVAVLGNEIDYEANNKIYHILLDIHPSCRVCFKPNLSLDEKVSLISGASLVLTGRLHAIFLAEWLNINTVAICYDTKIDYFLESINAKEDMLLPGAVTMESLGTVAGRERNLDMQSYMKHREQSFKNINWFIDTVGGIVSFIFLQCLAAIFFLRVRREVWQHE